MEVKKEDVLSDFVERLKADVKLDKPTLEG